MAIWKLKALTQGAIARLPEAERWNAYLQRYLSRSLEPNAKILRRRTLQASTHAADYDRFATNPRRPFAALELGTGWYPVTPLALALCGAEPVYTVDVRPLLDARRLEALVHQLLTWHDEGQLTELLPGLLPDRLEQLRHTRRAGSRSVDAVLGPLGITPLVTDARETGLPDDSIDLFVSNNTLEHIPEEELLGILKDFRRMAAPGAVASHSIDLGDHYTSADRSITPYNFLKYSDHDWAKYNNRLHYQNRLRAPDHRRLHEEAGFAVVDERRRPGKPELLAQVMPVADRFRSYSSEDLATTGLWMVARAA